MMLPIIDVSQWQGDIDFAKMKAEGCRGVIIRICNGRTLDTKFWENWENANEHFPGNVGIYPFVNPKRGSALDCAVFIADTIADIDVPFIMLDIESYQNESPDKGVIWPAAIFRQWLREHVEALSRLLPDVTLIGYTNAAFWNPYVDDPELASALEWIVPRYPVYSHAGYDKYPLPGVEGWDQWAFARAPNGPFPPAGAQYWSGWQFSAGFNRQGPRYGCQSSDLDLNIVDEGSWRRWTHVEIPDPEPIPEPEEPEMPYIFKLASGELGLRDVTGSRAINAGEIEGPLAEMPVYDVPKGSAWEYHCKKELAKYFRELSPPEPVQVTVPPVVIPDLKLVGTITK